MYTYKPVRFYLITFGLTWLFWILAIMFNEGATLYIFMLLGLLMPATTAIVTVMTSKNQPLKYDFKRKLTKFYRIKPTNILLAIVIFAVIVVVSIGISVLFGGSPEQFSFTEDFSFSIGGTSALLTILLASTIEELGWRGYGEDAVVLIIVGLWNRLFLAVFGLVGIYHCSGFREHINVDFVKWAGCMF